MPTTSLRRDQIAAYLSEREFPFDYASDNQDIIVYAALENVYMKCYIDTGEDLTFPCISAFYTYRIPVRARRLVQEFFTDLNVKDKIVTACLIRESGTALIRINHTQPPGTFNLEMFSGALLCLLYFGDALSPFLMDVITRRTPPSTALEQLDASLPWK